MSKKRRVLPVLVTLGATAFGGCTAGDSSTKDGKEVQAKDPKPTSDPKTEEPEVDPPPPPPPRTIIRDGDPMPQVLGLSSFVVPLAPARARHPR